VLQVRCWPLVAFSGVFCVFVGSSLYALCFVSVCTCCVPSEVLYAWLCVPGCCLMLLLLFYSTIILLMWPALTVCGSALSLCTLQRWEQHNRAEQQQQQQRPGVLITRHEQQEAAAAAALDKWRAVGRSARCGRGGEMLKSASATQRF
jgi:hypothetical protein